MNIEALIGLVIGAAVLYFVFIRKCATSATMVPNDLIH